MQRSRLAYICGVIESYKATITLPRFHILLIVEKIPLAYIQFWMQDLYFDSFFKPWGQLTKLKMWVITQPFLSINHSHGLVMH